MEEQQKQHTAEERSIVPQELHLKALSCYVGLPAETPPAYKCKQMQPAPRRRVKKRAVLTERRLIARPVNRCIKLSSALSDTLSGPGAWRSNESGRATLRR